MGEPSHEEIEVVALPSDLPIERPAEDEILVPPVVDEIVRAPELEEILSSRRPNT